MATTSEVVAQSRLCRITHLSRCSWWVDLQVALCQAWVRFEREHGSAEDHLQALIKTTPIVERAAAEAMAAANAEAAAVAQACCPAHHHCELAWQALLPASHRDDEGGNSAPDIDASCMPG